MDVILDDEDDRGVPFVDPVRVPLTKPVEPLTPYQEACEAGSDEEALDPPASHSRLLAAFLLGYGAGANKYDLGAAIELFDETEL